MKCCLLSSWPDIGESHAIVVFLAAPTATFPAYSYFLFISLDYVLIVLCPNRYCFSCRSATTYEPVPLSSTLIVSPMNPLVYGLFGSFRTDPFLNKLFREGKIRFVTLKKACLKIYHLTVSVHLITSKRCLRLDFYHSVHFRC